MYGENIPADEYIAEGLRFIRTTDIDDVGHLSAGGVYIQSVAPEIRLKDGDLLLSRSGTIGRSFSYRSAIHGPCAHAGYLVRFRPKDGHTGRFLFWVTKSLPFLAQLASDAIESTIANFNGQRYANLALLCPSGEEQRAIADFLDRETAKIDALIAAQERLIALLDEKRQATITHAVTKGLDPNVPMKESGAEWLGEVPAHWNISPLRYVARFTAGAGFPDAEQGLASEELPFFKVKDLSSGVPTDKLYETDNTISRNTACRLRATIFPDGTIVFAKIGAALLLNRFRMVGCNCCIDNNMMGMQCIPRVITPQFARILMSLLDMRLLVNPGAVPSLSEGKLSGLKVAVPPLDEQGAIEEHLDPAVAEIDHLRNRSEVVIERLRERRTALITAAVTGQIDVTHPAITEAAE